MSMLYTSLPLSDPTRQRYQSIIDNSRQLLARRWAEEGRYSDSRIGSNSRTGRSGFSDIYSRELSQEKLPLSAAVRNGKIIGTTGSKQNSTAEKEDSEIDMKDEVHDIRNAQREQQRTLQDIYNLMRWNSWGNNSFGWF